MAELLTCMEVREYISDYPDANLLLDKEEFSDTFIQLCKSLAISEFNTVPPKSATSEASFPSKSILLWGTLWQMYAGRSAMMARNHLNYQDGGLTIPVEEKFELYSNLAAGFKAQFVESTAKLKAYINMESGWGSVSSDEANFPLW
jgi:hypothetical protein